MAYCEIVKMPGGGTAIMRFSGRRPPRCRWCEKASTKLCDFVVSPASQVTHKRTCDAPMCDEHATSIGANRDFCPVHNTQEKLFG